MSSHFLSPHLPFSSCDSCLTSCPLMKSFLSLKAQLTYHLLSGVESSTTQLSRFSVLCPLGSYHSFAYTIHSYPIAWFSLSLLLACECIWAEPLLFIFISLAPSKVPDTCLWTTKSPSLLLPLLPLLLLLFLLCFSASDFSKLIRVSLPPWVTD